MPPVMFERRYYAPDLFSSHMHCQSQLHEPAFFSFSFSCMQTCKIIVQWKNFSAWNSEAVRI